MINNIVEKMNLELMVDLFTARVDGYNEHMLECIKGRKEGYIEVAKPISKSTEAFKMQ